MSAIRKYNKSDEVLKMELKPCPFCGSSGRIDEVSERHNGKSIDIWHVGCNGDDCFVESIIGFESEEKAVAA